MYLQNLNLQQVNALEFKADVLNSYANETDPSEDEIEEGLGQNYLEAANAVTPVYYEFATNFIASRETNYSIHFGGRNIWQRLKAFLCKVLNATSTAGDIIDAVVEFLLSIIPGGIVFKAIVKKIIKYFLNRGYAAMCPV